MSLGKNKTSVCASTELIKLLVVVKVYLMSPTLGNKLLGFLMALPSIFH